MKRTMIMLGAALALAVGGFADTHQCVQLWENGPLWAQINIGANSPQTRGNLLSPNSALFSPR